MHQEDAPRNTEDAMGTQSIWATQGGGKRNVVLINQIQMIQSTKIYGAGVKQILTIEANPYFIVESIILRP